MASNLIATINGKPVYSNKTVSSIVNGVIHFTDGSWCNVSTGEVVNNGVGYISIGTPVGKKEKVTREPKAYSATTLKLKDLPADVEISVGGDQIVVSMEGPTDVLEGIRVSLEGKTLAIEGTQAASSSGITVTSGRGGFSTVVQSFSSGRIISSSGNMVIGSNTFTSDDSSPMDTKITIKVPLHTDISISGVEGATTIGDTKGNLTAQITGGGKVTAGRLHDAQLMIRGSGDITASEVTGNTNATISGSGDITIQGGQTNTLVAVISGSGDIRHHGTVTTSVLTNSGSGDIYVARAVNRPMKSVSGSGDIRIGQFLKRFL